jgi:hypothetical protein
MSYMEVGGGCKSFSNTHSGFCAEHGGRLQIEGEAKAGNNGRSGFIALAPLSHVEAGPGCTARNNSRHSQGSTAPVANLSAPGGVSIRTPVHVVEEPGLQLDNLSADAQWAAKLQCALKGGRPLGMALQQPRAGTCGWGQAVNPPTMVYVGLSGGGWLHGLCPGSLHAGPPTPPPTPVPYCR